ncbi:uncharacterized protein LY79DRAFT_570407 [Colletotrichum navitas]|uniref:Uncharacterized protein n=1 Tax=Colletotrichum navitas TaxID=681940 RepID=A0AAD8UYG7_9PEZI|nr:uncharacterized protein LY79DRAFT_570407 [Colletotrichum navitas]KAK1570106.1 hypothetical protein LY79DRAFT_570407 [Colletotrichum navitas]
MAEYYGSVSVDDFTIGWVCAHPLELEIATKMMDEQLAGLPSHPGDSNTYALGLIEGHFVVAAFSPTAEKGTSPVATAARHMRLSYPSVRLGISIDIGSYGSWVPHHGNNLDIHLDDVVISPLLNNCDEAVQYDLGKVIDGHVTHLENKVAPLSTTVMAALEKLRTNHLRSKTRVSEHLSKLLSIYSSIVSPPEVMRDGPVHKRDAHELIKVWLFDTEVADLRTDDSQTDLPLVIIRGICDKNDGERLQQHAVAAAASYAKELLQILPPLVFLMTSEDKAASENSYTPPPMSTSTKVILKRWRPLVDEEPLFDSFIGFEESTSTGQIYDTMDTSPRPPLSTLAPVTEPRAKEAYIMRTKSKSDIENSEAEMHSNFARMWRRADGTPELLEESNSRNLDADDDEDDKFKSQFYLSSQLMEIISPDFAGFREHVLWLYPSLATSHSYLVDRIAHHQVSRYKALLDAKVKHIELGEDCSGGFLCPVRGGHSVLPGQERDMQDIGPLFSALGPQPDSGYVEGYLPEQSFPPGIPPPPAGYLLAKVESRP